VPFPSPRLRSVPWDAEYAASKKAAADYTAVGRDDEGANESDGKAMSDNQHLQANLRAADKLLEQQTQEAAKLAA